jgi:exopolysaccharide biosynthesis polyprenyl glycosylphosphotransferase
MRAAGRATGSHPLTSPANLQFVLVLSFAWIASIEALDVASCKRINREHTGLMAILVSVCVATAAAALLLALLGIPLPGMRQLAGDAAFLFIASTIINLSFRAILNTQNPPTCIVVVNTHGHGGGVSWIITRKAVLRHEISGAIRLESSGKSYPAKSAHNMDELVREIQREPLDGVLISTPLSEIAALSQRIGACGGMGAPVRFITDSSGDPSLLESYSNANCLYLLNTSVAPTKSWHYSILKRGFDLVFSLAAILVGLPLFALIALAIKVNSSKGGIFFAQDRVGWNGKVFRMYKFRTMHAAPPSVSDTRWSQPDDVRRTAVGRFLRKYSLDELPQFFNVLKGEMSVVGPRPERPYFVNSFRGEIDEYHRRHQIKVGITGWAQVNGLRGDTCIRTRVMYDLYYLQNWGLIFDLKIILRTVICVICGRNAD